ncbi:hypothetical protein [Desulfobotulus mexicanus]|nr:hypothetical protein [Desulfobotulus mexicanus]
MKSPESSFSDDSGLFLLQSKERMNGHGIAMPETDAPFLYCF